MARQRVILPPMTANPMHDADVWLEMQENRVHLTCCLCEMYLYNGDAYYLLGDDVYCPECMDMEFRKVVDLSGDIV